MASLPAQRARNWLSRGGPRRWIKLQRISLRLGNPVELALVGCTRVQTINSFIPSISLFRSPSLPLPPPPCLFCSSPFLSPSLPPPLPLWNGRVYLMSAHNGASEAGNLFSSIACPHRTRNFPRMYHTHNLTHI